MGLLFSKWKVIRTTWPYPEGYGTYRINRITGRRMVLDTGLSLDQAKSECKILNKKRYKPL